MNVSREAPKILSLILRVMLWACVLDPSYILFEPDCLLQKLAPGIPVPQRLYCQGTSIPDNVALVIAFALADGRCFPAELALAGKYNLLVDGNSAVFTEQNQSINLRIEVPKLSQSSPSHPSSNFHIYSGQGTMDGEHK